MVQSEQLLKVLDFALKAGGRIRGMNHVEDKDVVAGLLKFDAEGSVGFRRAGPKIAANGARLGLPWPRGAQNLADFLDGIFAAQAHGLDRAVGHIPGGSLEALGFIANGGKIKLFP